MSAAAVPSLRYTLDKIQADPVACLKVVMAAAPSLTSHGWWHPEVRASCTKQQARDDMLTAWSVEQFLRAAEWLDQAPRCRGMNRRATSYGWKHIAENWHERRLGDGRGYISNGMFLAACVAMGCRIEPVPRSLNPHVAIHERARRAA